MAREIGENKMSNTNEQAFTINRQGCTRIVIMTRRYAFKIPNVLEGCRLLYSGLLANLQESCFEAAKWPELCPVVFSLPFGLLIVMPRARVLTESEFMDFDYESFIDRSDCVLPVEAKPDSFGRLNGRIVAIDYGS